MSKAEKRSRKNKRMLKTRVDVKELFQKKSKRAVKAEMARKRILTTSFLDGKINKDVTNAISEKLWGRKQIVLY